MWVMTPRRLRGHHAALPKVKTQWQITLRVSDYCLLVLYGSVVLTLTPVVLTLTPQLLNGPHNNEGIRKEGYSMGIIMDHLDVQGGYFKTIYLSSTLWKLHDYCWRLRAITSAKPASNPRRWVMNQNILTLKKTLLYWRDKIRLKSSKTR